MIDIFGQNNLKYLFLLLKNKFNRTDSSVISLINELKATKKDLDHLEKLVYELHRVDTILDSDDLPILDSNGEKIYSRAG